MIDRHQSVIEIESFSKHYGDVAAVDGIDLRVQRGEIYAFLGLNGAGKTTTIRALLGMVKPTRGRIRLFGEPVGPRGRGPWHRVGHLVETPAAYGELTVRENLEVARRLGHISDRGVVDRALDRLGLAASRDRRAGQLSSGNLQRLALARALMHSPDLVVLDEPSSSLDPAGVVEIRELLRRESEERDLTVFMSSHLLAEVERLATRVGIIHRGRLIAQLDREQIERGRKRWLVVDARDRGAALQALRAGGYESGTDLRIETPRALDGPDEVARLLVAAGQPPTRLAIEHEDLEAYVLRLIESEQ